MMAAKIDYRELLTKRDIVTVRKALREAIMMCRYHPQPETVVDEKATYEALLKKINGMSIQAAFMLKPEAKEKADD